MSWREVPLRALYRRVEESGRPDLPLLSVYRDHGVVLREGREDNLNRASEDLSKYKVVGRGDLVLNKMKTWQGSLGVSDLDGIVSPAYFVGRRVGDVDNRFMHHLLRSVPLIAEYAARSKGIRPSQWDLPWDEFATIKVRLPDAPRQRAIANYLDAETERIDALIAKKQQMQRLIDEHLEAIAHELLDSRSGVQLRRVADLMPGYAFASSDFSPTAPGPLLLRGINVGVGALRWDDAMRFSGDVTPLREYRLQSGDLVLGMDRPFVGGGTRVAVVTEAFEGALLVQRVCRIRCSNRATTHLVRWALASRRFRAYVEPDLSGVSVPHLSEAQIGAFEIPLFPTSELDSRLAQIVATENRAIALKRAMARQIHLMQEHRQALISAAVTGELEIPGVA